MDSQFVSFGLLLLIYSFISSCVVIYLKKSCKALNINSTMGCPLCHWRVAIATSWVQAAGKAEKLERLELKSAPSLSLFVFHRLHTHTHTLEKLIFPGSKHTHAHTRTTTDKNLFAISIFATRKWDKSIYKDCFFAAKLFGRWIFEKIIHKETQFINRN